MVNTKTLATETNSTWHHQNPILSPQQAMNNLIPEKQDSDLQSYLMKIIEDIKEDINNSLKEI